MMRLWVEPLSLRSWPSPSNAVGRVARQRLASGAKERCVSDKDGKDLAKDGFAAVERSNFGGKLFNSADEFNTALDHVARLLEDVVALFGLGSFGSAAFLAITALEETSKANVGTYRRDKSEGSSKGRDPLRDHKAKHAMAVLSTVFMTDRIVSALGQDRATPCVKKPNQLDLQQCARLLAAINL